MQFETNKICESRVKRTGPRFFFRKPAVRLTEEPRTKSEHKPVKIQRNKRIELEVSEATSDSLTEPPQSVNSTLHLFQQTNIVSSEFSAKSINCTSSPFGSPTLGTSVMSPFGSPKSFNSVSSPFGSPKAIHSSKLQFQSPNISTSREEIAVENKNVHDGFDSVETSDSSTEYPKLKNPTVTVPLYEPQNTVDFTKPPFQSPIISNFHSELTEIKHDVNVELGQTETSQTSTEPLISVNLTLPPFQPQKTTVTNSDIPPIGPKIVNSDVPPFPPKETSNSEILPVLPSNVLTDPVKVYPSTNMEENEFASVERRQPSPNPSQRSDPFVELAIKCVPSFDSTKDVISPVGQEKWTHPTLNTPLPVVTNMEMGSPTLESLVGKFVNIETELEKSFRGRVFSVDLMFNSIMLGCRSRPNGPLSVQLVSGFAVKSISSIDNDPISSTISYQELRNFFDHLAKKKMEFQQSRMAAVERSTVTEGRGRAVDQSDGRGANRTNKRGRGQSSGRRYLAFDVSFKA